jgi:hypothetical protein
MRKKARHSKRALFSFETLTVIPPTIPVLVGPLPTIPPAGTASVINPSLRYAWPLALGFRRGSALLRTQLAVIAFLVIGLPFSSVLPVSSSTGSQQQRKATGAGSVAVWANNQGIKAGEPFEGEPINLGGDGRYDPRQGKYFMNRFRKKGLVRYNRSLQVNSPLVIGFLRSRPMSVVLKG